MPVSSLVPRAGDCPYRQRAWEWLRPRLETFGEVVEGWGDAHEWRKADAIADALSQASGDLLVISDADVWSDHLTEAIDAVASGQVLWASPHRHVRRLTAEGTEQFMAGDRDAALEENHHAVLGGGVVVMSRESYERVPMDPRFVGWGSEDKAAAASWRCLLGKPLVIRQALWHLWHPPQPRMSRTVGNVNSDELRGRYIGAAHSPRQMRQLIEEGRSCQLSGSSPLP